MLHKKEAHKAPLNLIVDKYTHSLKFYVKTKNAICFNFFFIIKAVEGFSAVYSLFIHL